MTLYQSATGKYKNVIIPDVIKLCLIKELIECILMVGEPVRIGSLFLISKLWKNVSQ